MRRELFCLISMCFGFGDQSSDFLSRDVLFVITSISLTVLSLKSSDRTIIEDTGTEQTNEGLIEDLLEQPQLD